MANADQELQMVERAACLIVGKTKNGEGNLVSYKGTGFHYGNGWIMTVAHNFQDENEMNETIHSIFSNGKFRVEFDIEGQKYVFPAEERKRMAFIHHLEPGEDTDFKNKDIAMVKLGHQWGHGGRDYPPWEEEERKMLDEMGARWFALCEMGPLTPIKNETVYAVHFGGANHSKKSEKSKILRTTPPSPNQVSMLHLEKKKGVLPAGASGCPIMVKRGVNYRLVGLHFSGDDDNEDGGAQALPWNQGIRDYINTGVGIIAGIGSYMAYSRHASQLEGSPELQETASDKARGCREGLESKAEGANVTIYLCNGEVINQQ
ncbi:hypothetical protein OS493_028007 [Desmophyllum pertusum]|uniref:Serine protease n=1 Tax=Desmophyllum pertusum TaxID=174260 RepID=A0A9W9ZY91_9CNID|nr:hypothetical protein OS493_028007 [Desmophyllum pertusum]